MYFMKKMTIMLMTLFFLFFFWYPSKSNGEENESPINVYPIYPENQLKEVKGYYHLQVNPGEEQTIYIDIENFSDKEQMVLVYPVDAYTGPTGGIRYEEQMKEEESRLLHADLALSKYISKQEITIPPKQVERVSLSVKVPDVEGGTFIGGIRVAMASPDNQDQDEATAKDQANVVIDNKITFTVGIQLDLPTEVQPNFSFEGVEIRTTSTGRNLAINMVNDAQMILRGTTGTYRVVYKDDQELFQGEFDEFTMVPNSVIHFPVKWESEVLEPGEYKVFLTANVMGKEIEEVRTLRIENQEAEKHAQQAEDFYLEVSDEEKTSVPVWIWVVGVVGILLLLGFVYWLGTRKRV